MESASDRRHVGSEILLVNSPSPMSGPHRFVAARPGSAVNDVAAPLTASARAGIAAAMRNFLTAAALGAATLLAGCSLGQPKTALAPPRVDWGYTVRARDAMAAKWGIAGLKNGDWRWAASRTAGPTDIVVNLSQQMAWVYRGGQMVGATTISSGMPGRDSPAGYFPILSKDRFHKSNRYSAAPMPFMLRLNWYGVAMHGGELPGYPASHGCIRLPMKFAEKLFSAAAVGDRVFIES